MAGGSAGVSPDKRLTAVTVITQKTPASYAAIIRLNWPCRKPAVENLATSIFRWYNLSDYSAVAKETHVSGSAGQTMELAAIQEYTRHVKIFAARTLCACWR